MKIKAVFEPSGVEAWLDSLWDENTLKFPPQQSESKRCRYPVTFGDNTIKISPRFTVLPILKSEQLISRIHNHLKRPLGLKLNRFSCSSFQIKHFMIPESLKQTVSGSLN